MATKKASIRSEYESPRLKIAIAEAQSKIQAALTKGEELKNSQIRSGDDLRKARETFYTWNEFNGTLLKRIFSTIEIYNEYDPQFGVTFLGETSLAQEISNLYQDIERKIRKLSSIYERLELFELDESVKMANIDTKTEKRMNSKKVFIVHGRDEAVRETVARYIDKFDLEPIILHEQANDGRTIVEKFEANSDVGFAIVLLTPDDEGKLKHGDEILKDRARQNVILELGYFLGKLGRSRVCALHKGSIDLPSDFLGVIYVPFDDASGWKLKLAKELKSAGYDVDMNKAI